jgi:ubiquitin carboxyl-terminal hydrolase L3
MEVIVDIESDPEAFTELARKNFKLPKNWAFCEIFGFEPDLLSMIPQPCIGVLLLFDCNCKALLEVNKKAMKKALKDKKAQHEAAGDLFFVNQLVGRSCGGLGVLHLMANNLTPLGLTQDATSTVTSFVHAHSQSTPKERGVAYVALANSEKLNYQAQCSAKHVDFTKPELDPHDKGVHPHFISFLQHKGMSFIVSIFLFILFTYFLFTITYLLFILFIYLLICFCLLFLSFSDWLGSLWELDPSMAIPFCHGACTNDNFLAKAVQVIQEKFIANNPNSTTLCMMALVKQD